MIVIGFLGVALVVPQLSGKLEAFVSRLSGKLQTTHQVQSTGFKSGFITGLSLGIIWTPCAGPILATIAALAAMQEVNFGLILVTIAYIAGVGIPLFIFATLGKYIFTKTRILSQYTGRVQQVFGVIMILAAIAIVTNYDKVLQAKLLDIFPAYGQFVGGFENNDTVKKQLEELKNKKPSSPVFPANVFNSLFNENKPAPDFVGITKWLNTEEPLSIENLKGKVVLVDFWTYTCINCIRTLPYVTSWYEKYKDKGFVVIGVHTPEFEFEKNTDNVLSAIKQYNIHYPVAQDNEYATWRNYENIYWPAEYLIDANATIRRTHFGEGKYDEMEMAIQELLKEAGKKATMPLEKIPDQTPRTQISPETYLGSQRMKFYYPSGNIVNSQQTFTLSQNLPQDTFSLGGEWTITDDHAIPGKNAVLNYDFYAGKVFLVLRPGSAANAKVKVFVDDKPVDTANAGSDVKDGVVTINSDRLYNLIDLKGKTEKHILKLEFENSGVEVFAFTFG